MYVGRGVGIPVGVPEGSAVGTDVGVSDGGTVGTLDGTLVGVVDGSSVGLGDGGDVGADDGSGVGHVVFMKRQQASMPLAGLTPPSQPLPAESLNCALPSRTRSPPSARMSSALVMASGPSCADQRPEPVRSVMEPVVVISPSSHAMAGHLAVGDGVGTPDGGFVGMPVGRDVGAVVGTPDGEAVGSVVGTVDGTPEGCSVFHVGSSDGALVGSGDGTPVGTALGTKEK